jgi:hypothetical protein
MKEFVTDRRKNKGERDRKGIHSLFMFLFVVQYLRHNVRPSRLES